MKEEFKNIIQTFPTLTQYSLNLLKSTEVLKISRTLMLKIEKKFPSNSVYLYYHHQHC